MARRKGGRRGGMKIPIISIAILGSQVAAAHALSGGAPLHTLNQFAQFYTGIDVLGQRARPEMLMFGYVPWIAKRFIGAVARPRVPFKGLPISLS